MKFLLASSNPGKAKELLKTFEDLDIQIENAPESLDVAETGATFTENALLKAEAYFKHFKVPTVSDDSGLVVECLPGELGVRSARFAEHLSDYGKKCEYLLERLEETKAANRNAAFVCVLCFYFGPEDYFFFEGNLSGELAGKLKGFGGFGYDPIFVPEGQSFTLAENPEWKADNSHRGQALKMAKKFMGSQLSR